MIDQACGSDLTGHKQGEERAGGCRPGAAEWPEPGFGGGARAEAEPPMPPSLTPACTCSLQPICQNPIY